MWGDTKCINICETQETPKVWEVFALVHPLCQDMATCAVVSNCILLYVSVNSAIHHPLPLTTYLPYHTKNMWKNPLSHTGVIRAVCAERCICETFFSTINQLNFVPNHVEKKMSSVLLGWLSVFRQHGNKTFKYCKVMIGQVHQWW